MCGSHPVAHPPDWPAGQVGRSRRRFFAIRFDPKKEEKCGSQMGEIRFGGTGFFCFFFTGFLQQSVPADVDTLAIGFSLVLSGFFFNTTDSFTGVFTGFYLV